MKTLPSLFPLLSFLVAAASAAQPMDFRLERDISYLPAGRAEKADLYSPLEIPAGQRVPAVVIIHGGGFVGGKRNAARELNIGGNLARHGYIALSIDYALAAPGKPTWPQNLHDAKTAVRWLRKNADRLRIDPAYIGVIGGSAGGTLAGLVTLTRTSDGLDPAEPDGDISCAVQCGVNLYGIAEMGSRSGSSMFDQTSGDVANLARQASLVTYARSDAPPLLIVHGTADKTVPVQQSELLAETLKKARAPHELIIIPDAPHTFDLQPEQRDLRPVVLGFFDRYLKPAR